ncbi:hypothetical protein VP01_1263g5 [Puccinia sorghi]|uniref:Defect at low temperature protein 1 n=1 Tax=Puccinia sorghi TaxID=27349 RepID=A0A0L6VP63_9BASI|nr:hypothetical protein VP01_1263g5 [Puccinia sorghi]
MELQTTTPVTAQLTAIVLGSTLLVIIVSLLTSISRYFTVRHTLASIPKPYIPISQGDLPNPIFQIISQEYARIAIISYLASKPTHPSSRPSQQEQEPHEEKLALAAWGKPGSIYHGKRFADQILKDFESLERALDGFLPTRPSPPIPTRHSSTVQGPLRPYLDILSPSSPIQPTPILLTAAQKLILNRYASLIQKAISTTSAVVTQSDYEIACKCLVILLDQIKLCRSHDWSNPVGFGPKSHPLYQGIRFKDAIIETAIQLGIHIHFIFHFNSAYTELASQTRPHLTIQTNPLTIEGDMSGKEAIENLIKKIFPIIYPPFLPSFFVPIITGYETLIKDIAFLHPHQERSLGEYEYSLRCISSIISHVQQTLDA